MGSAVVVVTAARNRWYNKQETPDTHAKGDYRYNSLTDPGNPESVIAVAVAMPKTGDSGSL